MAQDDSPPQENSLLKLKNGSHKISIANMTSKALMTKNQELVQKNATKVNATIAKIEAKNATKVEAKNATKVEAKNVTKVESKNVTKAEVKPALVQAKGPSPLEKDTISDHKKDIREAFTGHLPNKPAEKQAAPPPPKPELTDAQKAHRKDIVEAFTGHIPAKTPEVPKVDVGPIPLPRDPAKVAQENQEKAEGEQREKSA